MQERLGYTQETGAIQVHERAYLEQALHGKYGPVAPAAPTAKGQVKVVDDTKKGRVEPGAVGTYRELRAQKKAFGETEPLDMDHQPSFAAQVKAAEAALGRSLTPTERTYLKASTPAIASPRKEIHQKSGTFGARNTRKKISEDASDLEKAASRDRTEFDKSMKERER